MKRILAAASLLALAASPAFAARDQIRIVGSSTVYPFTTTVAEQFGKTSGMKTPVVESTGTGGGFKLFCAGVGEDSPDFTNASRAIKKGEFEDCAKNGVTDIVEIKIGFDGLVPRPVQGLRPTWASPSSRSSWRWPSKFPTRTASSSPTPTRSGATSTRRCPT